MTKKQKMSNNLNSSTPEFGQAEESSQSCSQSFNPNYNPKTNRKYVRGPYKKKRFLKQESKITDQNQKPIPLSFSPTSSTYSLASTVKHHQSTIQKNQIVRQILKSIEDNN